MDYKALADEIEADSLGRGYARMTDAEVAASLNAPDVTVQRDIPLPTVYLWGVATSGLSDVRAAAESHSSATVRGLCAAALGMLSLPSATVLSVTNPEVSGMLSTLVAAGVLTAEKRDNLLLRGQSSASRADQLGLGAVMPGDVMMARGGRW